MAKALDENSRDIAAAIESVYGDDAGDAFLEQWREHVGFFVDYTVGGLTDDQRKQNKAGRDLVRYEDDFAALLSEATGGELEAGVAADALGMHVDSLVEAVDSVLAGDGKAFDLLYTAATEQMLMTASALAGAIVAANPVFSE